MAADQRLIDEENEVSSSPAADALACVVEQSNWRPTGAVSNGNRQASHDETTASDLLDTSNYCCCELPSDGRLRHGQKQTYIITSVDFEVLNAAGP